MKHTPLDFRAHEIEMVVRNWPEWNLMGHEMYVFMAMKSQKHEPKYNLKYKIYTNFTTHKSTMNI